MGCCGGGSWWAGRRPQEGERARHSGGSSRPETTDPLAILKERLAKGEITPEEYQRLVEIVKS